MASAARPTRRALRRVLRAVDAHVTNPRAGGSPMWRDHVLAEFRGAGKGTVRAPTTSPRESSRAAEASYASLVRAVHAHKEMLFDYGHSLEKEREQLKKASSTANVVGLQMPSSDFDHDKYDEEKRAEEKKRAEEHRAWLDAQRTRRERRPAR